MPGIGSTKIGIPWQKVPSGLPASLLAKFLFLWIGRYTGDNLRSELDGSVITVTGKDWTGRIIPPTTTATFAVPNNATYLAADGTDDWWFNGAGVLQQKTHADLIISDTRRTFVKYSDFEPYDVSAIGILKEDSILTDAEIKILNRFFKLWVEYWGVMMDSGYMKDNRSFLEQPIILEFVTTNPNQIITIPHTSTIYPLVPTNSISSVPALYDYVIDYGDGSPTARVQSYNDANATHLYATPGTYQVSILGKCNYIAATPVFMGTPSITPFMQCLTRVISWGGGNELKSVRLLYCANLIEVPEDTYKGLSSLIPSGIDGMFGDCISLTSVPETLFIHARALTRVNGTFARSGLTSIPENIFKYNINLSAVSNLFGWWTGLIPWFNNIITTVPENLFKYNVNITDFSWVFVNCDALTVIPSNIFKYNVKATNFTRAFAGCRTLTDIPAGLFSYNINATNFYGIFQTCLLLSSIPAGLFDNNLKATNFETAFNSCSNALTTVPALLFANNLMATNFKSCFQVCSKLQLNRNIFYADGDQDSRFASVASVAFQYIFDRSSFTGVQGEAPDLWNCAGTFTKTDAFNGAGNSLTSISNYNDIPATWK